MKRNSNLVKQKFVQYLISTVSMTAALYLAVLVDSILVGNLLGAKELAAVNLCNPVAFFSNTIFCILIFGGSTVSAICIGGQDRKGANQSYTLSIGICVIIQMLFMALGLLFCPQISALLSQNGELTTFVQSYLFLVFLSIPIIGISSGIAAFARIDGFTSIAAVIPIVSNVVNLALDIVFMKFLHMGIAGAGWATICGYLIGCLILIPYLTSKKRTFHFTRLSGNFIPMLKEILLTGLPSSLSNACNFAKTLLSNMIILATMGSVGIQILTICTNAGAIVNIISQGAGSTILPIAGALYGEKDRKGILYAFRSSMMISTVSTGLFIILFECFPTLIANLCGMRDPELLTQLVPAFRVFVLSFLVVNIVYQLKSLYQATGNRKAASIVTVMEGAVVIIPTLLLTAKLYPSAIWAAFVAAEVISLILVLIYAAFIAKKKHLNGLLLLDYEDYEKTFDVTIENSINEAVNISEKIIEFCLKNQIEKKYAVKIGAAAEEMTVNIAKYAYKKENQNIDVSMRILEKSIVLKIRDNGEIFNPLAVKPPSDQGISGIEFVKKIADDVSYNRVVGFNVTIVTINR